MRKKPPFLFKLVNLVFIIILMISGVNVLKSATWYMNNQYDTLLMHLFATLFLVSSFIVLSGVAYLGHLLIEGFEACQDYSLKGLKYAIGLVEIEEDEFDETLYVPWH